jgi:hypothetical protein
LELLIGGWIVSALAEVDIHDDQRRPALHCVINQFAQVVAEM